MESPENSPESLWIRQAETVPQQERPFGTIRHFPLDQARLRASQVELLPGRPAPVTRHKLSGELVYVLAGCPSAYLDGAIQQAPTGTTLYLPPGSDHGFKVVDEPATLLVVHVPAVPPADDHETVLADFDAGGPPGLRRGQSQHD